MRIRACHATGSCAQQAERIRVSMSLLRAFDFSCKRALAEHHDSRLPCLGHWIGEANLLQRSSPKARRCVLQSLSALAAPVRPASATETIVKSTRSARSARSLTRTRLFVGGERTKRFTLPALCRHARRGRGRHLGSPQDARYSPVRNGRMQPSHGQMWPSPQLASPSPGRMWPAGHRPPALPR
jgi:hypothetical protein